MYPVRENKRNKYVLRYGRQTANTIRRLEYLKTTRARKISSLNFLKRCRDHNLIPRCVQITPKKDIRGSARILNQASRKMLRHLIHQHHCDLVHLDATVERLCQDLRLQLSQLDFDECILILNRRETSKYNECKLKQIEKYNKLSSLSSVKRNATNVNPPTIDKNLTVILEKGLNFAVTPRQIPYEEIICSVEDCLVKNNMRKEDAEALRQDISSVLRHSKVPKSNLSREHYLALKNLRSRPELTILRADKGNATVVMDTSDYKLKMAQLLSDENTYKRVKCDQTNKILKKTSDLVRKYSEKLSLDDQLLIPSCAKPPKLYGLPKIHKPNAPLRPIVSQIDAPTYKLAQHVAKTLSRLRGTTMAHVKDSYQFISEVKDLHLADDESMVSFDVQSLFTSLPVQDCIEITKRKLAELDMPLEYAELLEHCLTSGYLLWDNEFYVQVDGVAMGSPVSPVVADIFMEDFEARALSTAPVSPRFYKRYVDDTFTILPTNSVSAFLDHLNSIHPKIQFTMEVEANNRLAFLDVLLTRNPDHTLSHTVFRKPTHTDKYLNGASHHHPGQLATVGKTLFQRARGICDDQHLAAELQHVRKVLQDNQLPVPRRCRPRAKRSTVERQPAVLPYMKGVTDKIGNILKRASIKTYFKPPKKIHQFLPPVKCNIPLQDAGVYRLECDCGLSYIGQTKRSIGIRIKEHIADVKHRRNTKSAVCEHALDTPNHFIRFDQPKVLARERRFVPRMLREAIEIRRHPNFNREDGWKIPPAWDPVLTKTQARPRTARLQDTVSSYCVDRNVN
ncbi:hypothetical protein ABMA28_014575 [Loxostege sticticalis]|uniref:Reverse transcriptase domain-containing protein n=1 Tax=Loxostege sticticalis TaxID=481309 RepID=A0ABD0THA9_LOXSC